MQIINPALGLEAGRLLELVAESLPLPLFVIDSDGRYLAVLGATDRNEHHDPTPVIGLTFHDVLPPDLADELLAAVHRTLEDGSTRRVEFFIPASALDDYPQWRGPAGDTWYEARVCPAPAIQTPKSVVVTIISNITERIEHRDALTRLATTDSLTGLLNRRAFIEQAEPLCNEHQQASIPACLVLIDLDHFKLINDDYGHGIGDIALQHLSRIFSAGIRTSDLLGRLGGEEFACLLLAADLQAATRLIDRFHEQLRAESMRTELDGNTIEIPIRFSAGIARIEPEESLTCLLRRADLALYAAKNNGRDRTVLAEPSNTDDSVSA
jgi:diguanylate cyclase (GGDEF)-like protein